MYIFVTWPPFSRSRPLRELASAAFLAEQVTCTVVQEVVQSASMYKRGMRHYDTRSMTRERGLNALHLHFEGRWRGM